MESPRQGRGDSGAHSVTNFKRSARGPQSGQNHQSPDFAVRDSIDAYYSPVTLQTRNVQVRRTTGNREDVVGVVNCLCAWPAVSVNRPRRCSR